MDVSNADGRKPTDDVLLTLMAARKEDWAAAKNAWEVFYLRHVRFVSHVAERHYSRHLGGETVPDLVVDTFRRVFERATTFRLGSSEIDADGISRRVRSWMGTIIRNAAMDLLRERKAQHDPRIRFVGGDPSSARQPGKFKKSRMTIAVNRAFKQLTEREREVLRVTFYWYDGDRKPLPKEVVRDVCSYLDITPTNLRKIREHAIARVKRLVREDLGRKDVSCRKKKKEASRIRFTSR